MGTLTTMTLNTRNDWFAEAVATSKSSRTDSVNSSKRKNKYENKRSTGIQEATTSKRSDPIKTPTTSYLGLSPILKLTNSLTRNGYFFARLSTKEMLEGLLELRLKNKQKRRELILYEEGKEHLGDGSANIVADL